MSNISQNQNQAASTSSLFNEKLASTKLFQQTSDGYGRGYVSFALSAIFAFTEQAQGIIKIVVKMDSFFFFLLIVVEMIFQCNSSGYRFGNQDPVIDQIFAEVHVCKSGCCFLTNSNFIREMFLAYQAIYL